MKIALKSSILLIITFFCLPKNPFSQEAQLAPTPPMGWNSWNFFESEVSESIIREMADAMVSNGMKEAGYTYLIIDDHWVGGRDKTNRLYPDPLRFPGGLKSLADYVHERGLKLGIYSDAASFTCGGVCGSLGFEELDAQTFADWGIDYLKYDYCNAPEDVTTAFQRYKTMGDALKKTGRPIVFSICEWGQRKPWLWAKAAGGHLWRTSWDSRDVWQSNNDNLTGIMEIFDQQENLAQYAGPGGWNDPDLLMVGLYGKGKSSSVDGRFKGCNLTEYKTHFSLWAMLAAPLILNFDLRKLDDSTAAIILNRELISINQDPMGNQAVTIYKNEGIQVLQKNLRGDESALCIVNRNEKPAQVTLEMKKDLHLAKDCELVEVFSHKRMKKPAFIKDFLPAHGSVVYRYRIL